MSLELEPLKLRILELKPLELKEDIRHRLELFLMICQLGLFCNQGFVRCFVGRLKSSHRLLAPHHIFPDTIKLASSLLEFFRNINVTQNM